MRSMFRKNFILVCAVMCAVCANAQRFSNQFVINARGGWVAEKGYAIGIGAERYFGTSPHAITLDAFYMDQKMTPKYLPINVRSALGIVGYQYSLESILPTPLNINLNAGFAFGSRNLVYDEHKEIEVKAGNAFRVGAAIGAQFECMLSSKISLFIEPKGLYLFDDEAKKFNFMLNGGLKIYL